MTDTRQAIRNSLPSLQAEVAGDERNVVLTLSRMWMTAATSDMPQKMRLHTGRKIRYLLLTECY